MCYCVGYNEFRLLFVATSGGHQGSNLRPLLVLLFINDPTKTTECSKFLFADLKNYYNVDDVNDCQD